MLNVLMIILLLLNCFQTDDDDEFANSDLISTHQHLNLVLKRSQIH